MLGINSVEPQDPAEAAAAAAAEAEATASNSPWDPSWGSWWPSLAEGSEVAALGKGGYHKGKGKGKCHTCGLPGHYARECPKGKAKGKGKTGRGNCHNCGLSGHYARECPKGGGKKGAAGKSYGKGKFGVDILVAEVGQRKWLARWSLAGKGRLQCDR